MASEHARPPWVELTPTGFVARNERPRRDLYYSAAMLLLSVFWTVLCAYGWVVDGIDGTLFFMLMMGLLIWFVSWVGVSNYFTVGELELVGDAVVMRETRFGRPQPDKRMSLAGAKVEPAFYEGSKGYTVCTVVITGADESELRMNLPGGLHITERDRAKAGLYWVSDALKRATPG